MQSTQQNKKFICALSAIFHPIIRLFSWRDTHTTPETTVLYNHHLVQLEFLTIRCGKSLNIGGTSIVSACYRRSDEGRIAHIRLFIKAHTSTAVGKFDRMALHVRLRDADTDELIKILGYSTPANSPESATTRFLPEGMVSEQLEGDLLTYGMRNNIIQWDWQHDPEATEDFGLSQCHFVEISIRAVRLVKAEFRLVSHFQNNGRVTKRSIPHREGMFVEQFLQLDDSEV